jgi:hypothetical protein
MAGFGGGQNETPGMTQRVQGGGGARQGMRGNIDTATLRRMRNMRIQQGGATRDTSARRTNVTRQVETVK